MDVVVKRNEKFAPLYNLPEGTEIVVLIGGRGGMKTYEASKFLAYSATVGGKRCQVLRDEKEGIKESILNEVLLRFDTANRNGVMNRSFTRLENGIKCNKTGQMMVFTKGFRASSLDKKANMKSVSNVDIAAIEEGEDIRDEDKFNTFSDSIRKQGSFVIFIMNTPDVYHWIVKRYFHAIPVTVEDEPRFTARELDGYFKLVPKGVRGCVTVQTNFRDNEHLPEKTIRQYESYGDPDDAMFNLHHYLTSIQGYSTTGVRGQVFKSYKLISVDEFNSMDYAECYGLDFGTSSPAGIVHVKVKGDNLYVRELNYEPLKLVALGKKLDSLGFKSDTLIVADCAEPDTIRELRRGLAQYFDADDRERYPNASEGFTELRGSPDKSIVAGIDKMLSMNIHVTDDSSNLIMELGRYVWATDRDGKPSGKPIDAFNHCFVGSTMVEHWEGAKRIDQIEVGDAVATSGGYKIVLKKFNNGRKKVRDYKFIFDECETTITCTPDHEVWTDSGWVEVQKLQEGMALCIGKSSEVRDTDCTTERSTIQEGASDCMSLFGNQRTVKCQQGITSTTRTEIAATMIYRILNAFRQASISLITCLRLIRSYCEKEWITQGSSQTSGMAHLKARNYIVDLQRRNGQQENRKHTDVSNAARSTKQSTEEFQSFAIQTARLKHLEVGESRVEQVYDLMVEDQHEYFANGVLVHNCIDPIRYVVRVHGAWF